MQEQPKPEGLSGPDKPSGPKVKPSVGVDNHPFGAALAPALEATCDGRLTDIHWFRADWQRGGALTGHATWRTDQDSQTQVVVKLPVPPIERTWLVRLGDWPDVVPQVYAHGESLGDYDIAWVIMERLPHGPLGRSWGNAQFDLVVEAAGRFYAAAATFPAGNTPAEKDWHAILDRARKSVQVRDVADLQRWNKALKKANRKLDDWLKIWRHRPHDQWCHGDLHPGNAMSRAPAPGGPALLLDFALAHVGHWVEDAVYFEHLFWSRPERLADRKVCRMIAKQRKKMGLSVNAEWPNWASIRRALLALSTPAMLEHEGNPKHVAAALQILEDQLGL